MDRIAGSVGRIFLAWLVSREAAPDLYFVMYNDRAVYLR